MRLISLVCSSAVFSLAIVLAEPCAAATAGLTPSTIYAGTNTGVIPDNDIAGRSINFSVSGFTSQVVNVEVDMTINHSYVGDLTATLISPNGFARLVVFARPGQQIGAGAGSPSNFAGTYTFSDSSSLNFWSALSPTTTVDVSPNSYRSSSSGNASTFHGGCNTSFAGAFGGLTPPNVNGSWSLFINDLANSDVGTVSAANLRIYYAPLADGLFTDGLENPPPFTVSPPAVSSPQRYAACAPAPFDYTGSGRTSYALVRVIGAGSPPNVQWFIKNNDGTATGGTVNTFIFGTSTDLFVGGDFDGDSITDAAFWRAGTPGKFVVRRSSRPDDSPLQVLLGTSGNDPSIVDDYDGDGRTDFAVYRTGVGAGNPSTTQIIYSGGGSASLTTGETGSFPTGGSDITGDGRAEIFIQSDAGAGVGRFRGYDAFSGVILQDFTAGTATDFITLGNYVGTTAEDVMSMRTFAGAQNWITRDGASGVAAAPIIFGATGNSRLSADFDGDGVRDISNWASGATAAFNWRKASDGSTVSIPFGLTGDYPPANSDVH
jgi:hypothetical protein